MTKKELIEEVSKEDYKQVCKKLLFPLWQDLYQDLVLIVLEYDEIKINRISSINSARFFLVGILLNMVNSNTSPFYKKYRSTYELRGELLEAPEIDTEPQSDHGALSAFEGQHWFDKNIFNAYVQHGSIRKVVANEGVSFKIVYNAINKVKKNVRDKMEKQPINILMIMTKDDTGLTYHRQQSPHARLKNLFPDDFKVTILRGREENGRKIEATIDEVTDEQLKNFQIIYYLRQISYRQGLVQSTVDRCHSLGIRVILDIDDYWKLNSDHGMYATYKQMNIAGETEAALKAVDHVITTTEYFASEIAPFNKNVTVIPNCINPEDDQFHPRRLDSGRVRFGWIGGVYHKDDLLSISEGFCRIAKDKDLRDQYQICLGGFNVSYSSEVIRVQEEYQSIEKAMTCNYEFRNYDATYTNYLFNYTQVGEHISYDKPYRRLWGQDVHHYGELYNSIDVALIPLQPNKFNRCKSELKLVEAGTMGKAVIVSDTDPYSKWIEHGVNGLKVSTKRNGIDWWLNMRKLIKEPNLRSDLASALSQTIKENFDMDKYTQIRADLYKQLCK